MTVEHVCASCGRKRMMFGGVGPPCDRCDGKLCWGCCQAQQEKTEEGPVATAWGRDKLTGGDR